jgi:hypothetical protein
VFSPRSIKIRVLRKTAVDIVCFPLSGFPENDLEPGNPIRTFMPIFCSLTLSTLAGGASFHDTRAIKWKIELFSDSRSSIPD